MNFDILENLNEKIIIAVGNLVRTPDGFAQLDYTMYDYKKEESEIISQAKEMLNEELLNRFKNQIKIIHENILYKFDDEGYYTEYMDYEKYLKDKNDYNNDFEFIIFYIFEQ